MDKNKMKLYGWLFYVNFFISAFTFGGGYVVIPMIRKFYVQQKQLFHEEALLSMAAIAQSSPGAIAINLASLAGYKVAHFKGALISCLGAVLPPLLLLSIISMSYTQVQNNDILRCVLRGMEAGVAAIIVDLVITMCATIAQKKCRLHTLLIPFSFLASFFFQMNVIAILCIGALLCLLNLYIQRRTHPC